MTEHAKRLDVERDLEEKSGPAAKSVPRVAVIGAGISGLVCARNLVDQRVPVTVFEKSRGLGGRMATRRSGDDLAFDHGAQYFTVRDERFARYVESWRLDGVVACWKGAIRVLHDGHLTESKTETARYVGTPSMTAVCKHLAAEVDVRLEHEIGRLEGRDDRWRVVGSNGDSHGAFDVVIVSAPSVQSAKLLASVADLADLARKVQMQPCWAVLVAFESQIPLKLDGAFVHASPLSWIARNSSKPARARLHDCWVLHGSADWSRAHAESTVGEVAELLLREFWSATGAIPQEPSYVAAHRWRYALPPEPLMQRCLFDSVSGLGACGDWCSGPRVEGAFLSGAAAAEQVLRAIALGPDARGRSSS